MKNKTLQEQFEDLLTCFDSSSHEVDIAQIDVNEFNCETDSQAEFEFYQSILEYRLDQLRHSFDAIAQFFLDHRDSIRFE